MEGVVNRIIPYLLLDETRPMLVNEKITMYVCYLQTWKQLKKIKS